MSDEHVHVWTRLNPVVVEFDGEKFVQTFHCPCGATAWKPWTQWHAWVDDWKERR